MPAIVVEFCYNEEDCISILASRNHDYMNTLSRVKKYFVAKNCFRPTTVELIESLDYLPSGRRVSRN